MSRPVTVARHGSLGGWSRHKRAGERPCDACFRARQEYDRRRKEAPRETRRNRLNARAQRQAYQALSKRHVDEYRALYSEFRAAAMAELDAD